MEGLHVCDAFLRAVMGGLQMCKAFLRVAGSEKTASKKIFNGVLSIKTPFFGLFFDKFD
jgi:hypothetical protein